MADGGSRGSGGVDGGVHELAEEARLNRGVITVYEQTKETESNDKGDRFLKLGYDNEICHLDEEKEDFITVAVPIAHVDLPEPFAGDEELSEWLSTDVGKLAMGQFFDVDLASTEVLTRRGREMVGSKEVDDD